MGMSSAFPARFDEGQFDYSRFDVYAQDYENMFAGLEGAYRNVTLRHRTLMDRHATTGWFNVAWSESTINGVLVEQGGSMPAFAAGVVMRQDAVLICVDGLSQYDQIYDASSATYFEVQQIEKITNPYAGGFAFRVAHLHRLELFRKS
jgi:hypothetical protein